jgi:Domain of unknown function (DUF4386)
MRGMTARQRARLAGALYLFIVVAGTYAEVFVRSTVIVPGDPDATATRMLAAESRYRWAAAGELLMWAFDITVTLLLYELLRPVGKSLALLAAVFRLVAIAVLIQNTMYHFAPLGLLGSAPYMSVLGAEQARALALYSLRMHGMGYNLSLIYFGFHCLLLGYLISRSDFLPRVLGWVLVPAGLGYLINSFAGFVAPSVAGRLFPWVLMPAFFAELALSLWLLAMGVNAERWEAQATS